MNLNKIKGKVKSYTEITYKTVGYFSRFEKSEIDCRVERKYDERGSLIEETRYNSGGSLDMQDKYKYDERGNLIEETRYKSDGSLDVQKTYKYDARGNLIEERYFKAACSLVFFSSQMEHHLTYKHDSKGNKIEATDYNSDGSTQCVVQFNNTYDDKGNLIKSTPNLNLRRLALQHDVYSSHIDLSTYTYLYDDNSNLIRKYISCKRFSFDETKCYKYDERGEKVIQTRFISSQEEYGHMGDLNKVTREEDSEYDNQGNLIKYWEEIGSQGDIFIIRDTTYLYEYDDRGNWTKMILIDNTEKHKPHFPSHARIIPTKTISERKYEYYE